MRLAVAYIPLMSASPPKTRLYVESDLGNGVSLSPTHDQQHYLTTVMRLGDGDAVAIFNGRDGEWRARIES